MKKIKLAFLAPEFYPPWGGVGIYSIQLVKELSKMKDMEIHIFTPERGEDYSPREVLKFFDNKIILHNLGTAKDNFKYNLDFQLNLFKEFPKYHKKYKFDSVHSANLVHMPDIFLKSRNLKVPTVVTAHTTIKGQVEGFLSSNKNFLKMAPSEKNSILFYPGIASLEWIYLKKTDYMLTVSNKFIDTFRKQYKYNRYLKTIYNGISLEQNDYQKIDKKVCLEKFPALKNVQATKVLFAGRLITQKGVDKFVRLIKELKGNNVHFVIAGKGDEKRLYQMLMENNISIEDVTFLGFVENKELPYLLKLCDIFVLPSYYENFPISLLEAMSMKMACVATDVGAVDEIITHEKTGFLVKKGDFVSLKYYVKKLIKDTKLRKKISENGYRFVVSNLTTEIMAKKTKEVYEHILTNEKRK